MRVQDTNDMIERILAGKHTQMDNIGVQIAMGNIIEEDENLDSEYAIYDGITDAKLSTAQRKKLKSSTFCGPGKSFPVPDCSHVTAARRLIGRYKGPGDKSKILACVNRRAKTLGCSSGDSSADILSDDAFQDKIVKIGERYFDKVIEKTEDGVEDVNVEAFFADITDNLRVVLADHGLTSLSDLSGIEENLSLQVDEIMVNGGTIDMLEETLPYLLYTAVISVAADETADSEER